ncbi:MAG: glycoside hydrolase domain-containing protein, partial [Bacteroidales bacterium]
GSDGLPDRIESYFATEMTRLSAAPRQVLASPLAFTVLDADGKPVPFKPAQVGFVKRTNGTYAWASERAGQRVRVGIQGQLEFDGTVDYRVTVTADQPTPIGDVRLDIPVSRDVAKYMMGMGLKGGVRPATFDWKWNVERNQDSAWIGDVNAGLQFSMRDERYVRPLNTNFYQLKPLVMPRSWDNGGKGGCRFAESGDRFVATCFSGPRTLQPNEPVHYNFRLLVTPFHTLDTRAQWTTRFFHAYKPLDEVAATGANTLNIHHANEINPYINYPFLRVPQMKAYIDDAHRRGYKVKIYYTVRELSNRTAELFPLRSLGDEVLIGGPGGGPSWLQEHVGGNYIAGWYVPALKDAAIVTSGVSRWHNYYVEGLNWLVQHVGIDGLYIDDVAFDRTTMKRVRKVLERGRPGSLIDLHSANQFNIRDGFANSANLYLEHFPYLDRLWFGEYFDYNSQPDFWMVEMAGIPFGLMGEMLQDGGNPWRGMVYGMTNRLPWTTTSDPRPLWKFWDSVGMDDTEMIGYWVPASPVKTGRPDVLATTYTKAGTTIVSVASWAKDAVQAGLVIDWKRLGLDPSRVTITAPAIEKFQDARTFEVGEPIPIEPGRGWLLVLK